jgi:hypothetical protein
MRVQMKFKNLSVFNGAELNEILDVLGINEDYTSDE